MLDYPPLENAQAQDPAIPAAPPISPPPGAMRVSLSDIKEALELAKAAYMTAKRENDLENCSELHYSKILELKAQFIQARQAQLQEKKRQNAPSQKLVEFIPGPVNAEAAHPKAHLENWKSYAPPSVVATPLFSFKDLATLSDLSQNDAEAEKKTRLDNFKAAQEAMELSTAEAALSFVHKAADSKSEEAGPLLEFATQYSQRYLDLLKAYTEMEFHKKLPLIPLKAGQMKAHGFVTTQIISMKEDCLALAVGKADELSIMDELKKFHGIDKKEDKEAANYAKKVAKYNKSLEILMTPKKRKEYLEQAKDPGNNTDPTLVSLLERVENFKEKALMDKAFFLMQEFGHMDPEQILDQLSFVGNMDLSNTQASPQERLLMEIRHRISGDGSFQTSPGALGSNPLAYLNVLKAGEPGNLEAEFRAKMYFTYMLNHFSNAVVTDPEAISYINTWLQAHGKNWALDKAFIHSLQSKGPDYLPPIFRYGANAGLNSKGLRTYKTPEEMEEYSKTHPNITLGEAMNGQAPVDALFNSPLSKREVFNLTGDLEYNEAKHKDKPLKFSTGASCFNLEVDSSEAQVSGARDYIDVVKEYNIPVTAGISGTFDQSTTMAGLVGIGVSSDQDERMKALEVIRLAYLAFMLPNRDHTVHEIMQSARTFNLPYRAGPGSHHYIFPQDQNTFEKKLSAAQDRRKVKLPHEYLSRTFAPLAALKKSTAPKLLENLAADNVAQEDLLGEISDIRPQGARKPLLSC